MQDGKLLTFGTGWFGRLGHGVRASSQSIESTVAINIEIHPLANMIRVQSVALRHGSLRVMAAHSLRQDMKNEYVPALAGAPSTVEQNLAVSP